MRLPYHIEVVALLWIARNCIAIHTETSIHTPLQRCCCITLKSVFSLNITLCSLIWLNPWRPYIWRLKFNLSSPRMKCRNLYHECVNVYDSVAPSICRAVRHRCKPRSIRYSGLRLNLFSFFCREGSWFYSATSRTLVCSFHLHIYFFFSST